MKNPHNDKWAALHGEVQQLPTTTNKTLGIAQKCQIKSDDEKSSKR